MTSSSVNASYSKVLWGFRCNASTMSRPRGNREVIPRNSKYSFTESAYDLFSDARGSSGMAVRPRHDAHSEVCYRQKRSCVVLVQPCSHPEQAMVLCELLPISKEVTQMDCILDILRSNDWHGNCAYLQFCLHSFAFQLSPCNEMKIASVLLLVQYDHIS